MDLLILNALAVVGSEVLPLDIAIQKGKICALGHDLQAYQEGAQRVIDAQKRIVTPGGVDIHAHLSYFVGGRHTADTFASGTQAALFGGTTTVMDFVEAAEEESLTQALERRRREAQDLVCCDYSLHMSILPHDLGKLAEIPELVKGGCPTFKHYTAYSFSLDDGQLYRSFQAIAKAQGMAVVHAENWPLIRELIRQHLEAQELAPRYHALSRPAEAEAEAVERVLELARLAQMKIYLFHQGCSQALPLIERARRRGQTVYAETCPHYLALDDSYLESMGPLVVCSPPLRPASHHRPLIKALEEGTLDSVSSDHCPFSRREKEEAPNFAQTPGGLASIETRMTLIKDLPHMSLPRWVEVCATRPAQLVGLPHKGQLLPGFDADLVVWSHEPYTISAATLHEKVDWTPYEGRQVSSRPQIVISRGEVVISENQYFGQLGRGRYLNRRLK